MENIKYKEMQRVSVFTLILNSMLAAIKFAVGTIYKSSALISDGVNSISDVATTLLLMIGIKISKAPADKNHNYGHEKIEAVFSTILAMAVFAVGGMLCYDAVRALAAGEILTVYSPILLAATAFSIAVKEFMYRYTMHYAKKYNSLALKAYAWDHRSDTVSSFAVLIGIGGTMLFPSLYFLEPIATIIVSFFIIKVAISIYLQSIDKLIDKAADYDTVQKMSGLVCKIPGVRRIDSIKTRLSTYKIYVDIEIAVDGNLSLYKAHEIAQEVHDMLEHRYIEFNIKHINVHVNPELSGRQ